MKVNVNQTSNKEQPSKTKSRKPAAVSPETDNKNIYKESLKEYKAKWQMQIKDGGIFRQNKFWIIVCIILFVILLVINSNVNNKKTHFTVQLRNLKSQTTTLSTAIDEIKIGLEEQAKINAVKLTEEEEKLAYNNAIEQGVLVATLQNTYKNVNSQNNTDAYNANVNALDVCFDNDDKDARVKWYSYNDSLPGTWEFASKAAFKGNIAKVLWLCYADEDKTLLAYCTASYHADTKLFTNVDWKLTRYAESKIKTDDASAEENKDNIPSVIDSLKSLVDDGTIKTNDTGEDFNEDTIKKNNEVSDARNSLKTAIENGDVNGESFDSRYNVGLESKDETKGGNNSEISSE